MNHTPLLPTFHVYDTTLRDGCQQEGISLSLGERIELARILDDLGVTFIEGGWPGANPADTAFFEAARTGRLQLRNAELTAFGSTRRAGGSAASDPLTLALLDAETSTICLVAKSHDELVLRALGTTLEENLAMVEDTVSFLVREGRRVFLDCEHFFDGFLANPSYALQVVRTAGDAGANVVVLCDTNGGMLPDDIRSVTEQAMGAGVPLGIHCHNDSGCAVANTLAAVSAGVRHVQGTINGHGERTGNADLLTVVANLQLKGGVRLVSDEALSRFSSVARAVSDLTHVPLSPRALYVGRSSFAHQAGLHASALRVDANLYQHVDPSVVGNVSRTLVSDMAGRSNIQLKAAELGYDVDDRELASRVTTRVKELEAEGYSFESADASVALVRPDVVCSVVTSSQGPVHALDLALRSALLDDFPAVVDFRMADVRMRVLDRDTDSGARVRASIDTTDGDLVWTTVGVGGDLVAAVQEALVGAYRWGLACRITAAEDEFLRVGEPAA